MENCLQPLNGEKLLGSLGQSWSTVARKARKTPPEFTQDQTGKRATREIHSAGSPLTSKVTQDWGTQLSGVKAGQGWQGDMQKQRRHQEPAHLQSNEVWNLQCPQSTGNHLQGVRESETHSPLGLGCLGVHSQEATKLAGDVNFSVDYIQVCS